MPQQADDDGSTSSHDAGPVGDAACPEPERIRFSVVIPAYNEARYLPKALASLHAQDFPGGVEIIVVDNNSTDGTSHVARAFGATTLTEPRRGVCWARQRGTEAARGEIVLSTDADTVHPPTWLSRVDETFRANEGCVAVAGPCRFSPAPLWARIYPTLLFGAVHLIYSLTRRVCYATATNIAFSKAAFTGYDTTLTQGGDELGLLRCLRRQGPIVFDRTNVVTTSARRLREGLAYNIVVTFVFYYLLGYLVNRLTARTIFPTAPAFREERVGRPRLAWLFGVPLVVVLVIMAV
jgi:glycosyltransferase involved in cell wall biosynthesis